MTQNDAIHNDLISMNEAAEISHVGSQAIYVAIQKNKLKAVKKDGHWMISKKDLEDYRVNKFSRENRRFNGQPVYDLENGPFSILYVSKVLSTALKRHFPPHRLYHLLRTGQLKGYKLGSAWAIAKEDAMALLAQEEAKLGKYIAEII